MFFRVDAELKFFNHFFKARWFLESAFSEDGAVDFYFSNSMRLKILKMNYFRTPRV